MGNIDLLEDACARLPHTTRRMFGGYGVFAPNGGMFAGVVDDDRLILKFAKGEPAGDAFRASGAAPWVYRAPKGDMTMHEWLLVPDELYDDPRALAEWAAKAHRVAPAKVAKGAKKAAAPKKAAAKRGAPKKAPKRRAAKTKRAGSR